jgi:hypothetical protein
MRFLVPPRQWLLKLTLRKSTELPLGFGCRRMLHLPLVLAVLCCCDVVLWYVM